MTAPTRRAFVLALGAGLALPGSARAADADRQAEVARRGAAVMPFDLKATTHVFTKTARGGTQQVLARDPADRAQVRLARKHLKALRGQFMKGDFSDPERIHGVDMPGLAELRAAPRRSVHVGYAEVPGGAALTYTTYDTALAAALHRWFDAQLADHGGDAMAGHAHPAGGTAPGPKTRP